MRYETHSCILCEASASLLAKKVKNFYLKDLNKLNKIRDIKKTKQFIFPSKFKDYGKILNEKSLNRINCVILPIEALFKAIKIKR